MKFIGVFPRTLRSSLPALCGRHFPEVDYHELVAYLQDTPAWCEGIELAESPRFTTFQNVARRLLRTKPVAKRTGSAAGELQSGIYTARVAPP